MKQIRNNVFETNSSSTHCISIKKENPKHDIIQKMINENPLKEPFVLEGEFGWNHEKINDFHSKLCYLLMGIINGSKSNFVDNYEKLKNYLNEIYGYDVNIPTYHLETFHYNNHDNVFYKYDNCDDIYDSYIDHGNEVEYCGLIDYVLESKHNLISYLFNSESQIETGNDNEGTFEWWCGSNPYRNFDEKFQANKNWWMTIDAKEGETEEELYNRLKEDDDDVYRDVPDGFIEFYKGN